MTNLRERDTSALKNLYFVGTMSMTLPPRLMSRSPCCGDKLPLASNTTSKLPSSVVGSDFV